MQAEPSDSPQPSLVPLVTSPPNDEFIDPAIVDAEPPTVWLRPAWKHPNHVKWPTVEAWKTYVDGLKPDSYFYNKALEALQIGTGVYSSNHNWLTGQQEFEDAYAYLKQVAFGADLIMIHTRHGMVFTDRPDRNDGKMLYCFERFRTQVQYLGTWAVCLPDGTELSVVEVDYQHEHICCAAARGIPTWYDRWGNEIFWHEESYLPKPPMLMLFRLDRKEVRRA